MKARVPDRTMIAAERDKAQTDAIKLCIVTFVASLNDVGLAESTIDKILKKEKSYIDSIRNGNVEWQEIAESLQEEKGITFDWIGES
jgi:hypothetical protein